MKRTGIVIVAPIVALAAWAAVGAAEPVALSVEVRARTVAPGEPLRIVVETPERLDGLTGRFLDQDVFFVRQASPRDGATRLLPSRGCLLRRSPRTNRTSACSRRRPDDDGGS